MINTNLCSRLLSLMSVRHSSHDMPVLQAFTKCTIKIGILIHRIYECENGTPFIDKDDLGTLSYIYHKNTETTNRVQ